MGILRDCIMTSAEEIIGRARKKQPDWFIDATDILASCWIIMLELIKDSCCHCVLLLRKPSGYVRDW